MELKVICPEGKIPDLAGLRDGLAKRGFPAVLRIIDGELAFPDETPPAAWRELRLGTSQGMLTLRQVPDGVALVIWGNADQSLIQARNAVALADLSGGRVFTADELRQTADLPHCFQAPR
jgi:hypothetical protein